MPSENPTNIDEILVAIKEIKWIKWLLWDTEKNFCCVEIEKGADFEFLVSQLQEAWMDSSNLYIHDSQNPSTNCYKYDGKSLRKVADFEGLRNLIRLVWELKLLALLNAWEEVAKLTWEVRAKITTNIWFAPNRYIDWKKGGKESEKSKVDFSVPDTLSSEERFKRLLDNRDRSKHPPVVRITKQEMNRQWKKKLKAGKRKRPHGDLASEFSFYEDLYADWDGKNGLLANFNVYPNQEDFDDIVMIIMKDTALNDDEKIGRIHDLLLILKDHEDEDQLMAEALALFESK